MPKTRYWALTFVSLIWMITLVFWNAAKGTSVVIVGPLMCLLFAFYAIQGNPASVKKLAKLICLLQFSASGAIWLLLSYSPSHQAYFRTTTEFLLLSSIPTIVWIALYFRTQSKIEDVGKTVLTQEKKYIEQTSGHENSFWVSRPCIENRSLATFSELALLDQAITVNMVVKRDKILGMECDPAAFEPHEMQIPFVRIVQSPSSRQNVSSSDSFDGGSIGAIYNTVTGQIWAGDTGLVIILCYQTTRYFQFVFHESGGGSWCEIRSNNPILLQTSRKGSVEILPNGNQLVKSDYHFCLIVDEDGMVQPVAIQMKLSQLIVSRRWKTQIGMSKLRNSVTGKLSTPPLTATMWQLTSVEDTHDKNELFTWSVEKVGTVSSPELRLKAEAFREKLMHANVKAPLETVGENLS